MALSRKEVEHVAQLAHIGLAESEIEELSRQLSTVLDHISQLQELDTSAVEPTAQAVSVENIMRADVASPSWPPESVLANAPHRQGDFIEVQAVLD